MHIKRLFASPTALNLAIDAYISLVISMQKSSLRGLLEFYSVFIVLIHL